MSISDIAAHAQHIREDVITMLTAAGSGHAAGSLGMADVFSALYFGVLNLDPKRPWNEKRDRVVLSNGHICPVWYATLAEAGFFPKKELDSLRKLGSRLQGHPVARMLPGIENTAGSLGQGFSFAAGMALAAQLQQKTHRIFCITGDGEHDEGQIWETYAFGAAHKLSNLTVLIDRNYIQSEGVTEHILPLDPFKEKITAFGWNAIEVDGHNIEEILKACNEARSFTEKPTAIICYTIPGKGVDFIEGKHLWHAKAPNKQEALHALQELRTLQGKIRYES